MHLRRALLLFAIVLGFSALAASLAPPPPDEPDQGTETEASPPAVPPPPGDDPPPPASGSPTELRYVTGTGEPERRRVEAGEHVVVTVAVQDPGQVAIPGLGLLQVAEPGVPARFDVLASRAGRYEITFEPVDGQPERVGIIEVEQA